MTLAPGSKIGPYEIVSRIGAGGMGEVWKARDTRIDRFVAIKTSHAKFSDRFAQEVRAIAALNHPHICTLYDVGPDFLVMEYIEGSEIKGPLPLELALKYAIQFVSALEAAHRKGITHRDLKPANILVTKAGIKVLDFGLAKIEQAKDPASDETLTRALTQEGSILGTLQYMAPEQLQGKVTDTRADIFSFGCVFYEMLTGKRAFEGANTASVIAGILEREPPSINDVAPSSLDWAMRLCLAKDPDERWQSARDVRAALERVTESPADNPAPASHLRQKAWLAAALLPTALLSLLAFIHFRETPPDLKSAQFVVEPPPGIEFTNPYAATAVSPDGRYLVFGAGHAANPSLWLRPINSVNARQLPGTENGTLPFWSPDSKSVGFFANGKLERIEVAGGSPQILCDYAGGGGFYGTGGTWGRDGTILFASGRGLMRVTAVGGDPQKVAQPDLSRKESAYGVPQFLPDGKRFLYFIASADVNTQGIYAGSLDSPNDRNAHVRIIATSHKAYYAPPRNASVSSDRTGYLLWIRDQTLLAQPFNDSNLRLEGEPVPVAESVALVPAIRAPYWISDTGILAYRRGDLNIKRKLLWMSRDGKNLGDARKEDSYGTFRLSPDGKRLAFGYGDDSEKEDIWVLEFDRNVMSRLTFSPSPDNQNPVWSPDGRQLVFSSDRNGVEQLYRKDAGGGGQEEQLTKGLYFVTPSDWSRDGRYVLYTEQGLKTGSDIWALPMEGDRKPFVVLQTQFNESWAQFSPDGKWIAYQSNQASKTEIYVRSFNPSGGAQSQAPWQVTSQGGSLPRWRADGKELYYLGPDRNRIMAVDVHIAGESVRTDAPHELFAVSLGAFGSAGSSNAYDVTPDGRFLMASADPQTAPPTLTVVLNWQAGLKK